MKVKYENLVLIFTNFFSHCSFSDVDLNNLYSELKILQTTLRAIPLEPSKVLKLVETVSCYHNMSIAYSIIIICQLLIVFF